MAQRVPLARRAAALAANVSDAEGHESIPFDSGHAFPGLLPDLSAHAARAFAAHREEMLQYAPRRGLAPMREWLRAQLALDGVTVSMQELIVVNGAKHGIEMVCRLFLDEGDTVAVTAPTYFTALPIFRSFGADFLEIGQDEEGLLVDALAEGIDWLRGQGRPAPKFVYDIPDFHNPTGRTTSLRRREALVELCARHGMFIVEDSPYRSLRYEGDPVPSIKALDPGGLVIQVGTFSKILAPGIRIGWLACAEALVARLIQLKADGGSSPLSQRLILEYLTPERLAAHAALARDTYRRHRDCMLAALAREMPQVRCTRPQGGYYVWLTLPDGASGDELAPRARSMGVTVLPGSAFYARGRTGFPGNAAAEPNHVRLTYSHAGPKDIDEGVRRLASAWGSMK